MPGPNELDAATLAAQEKARRDRRVAEEARIRAMLSPRVDVEIGPAVIEAAPVRNMRDALQSPMVREDTFRGSREGRVQTSNDEARRAQRRREAETIARERAEGLTQRRFREADAPRAARTARAMEQVRREDPAFAWALDSSDAANAYQAGVAQGGTLGFSDELRGVAGALDPSDTYAGARDRSRQENADAAEGSPGWNTFGNVVGGLAPSLLIPGSTAESVGGRMLQSGGWGAGYGAVEGLGRAEGDVVEQGEQALRGAGMGAVTGYVGQGLAEIPGVVSAVRNGDDIALMPRRPRPEREIIEPGYSAEQLDAIRANPEMRALEDQRQTAVREAAAQRVMGTAGAGATRTDLQRAADYPDGLEGLARDIRREGIVRPEDGSLGGIIPPAGDTAQQRARFLAEDAGARVGAAEGRVHAAAEPNLDRLNSQRGQVGRLGEAPTPGRTYTPDEIAVRDARLTQIDAEDAARLEARSLPPDALAERYREMGLRMPSNAPHVAPEATAATPGRMTARQREAQANAMLARRAEGAAAEAEVAETIGRRDAPNVDMGRVAGRLRREAANIRAGNSPQAIARARELDELADHYAQSWEVRLGQPGARDPGISDTLDDVAAPQSPEITARRMLDDQRRQAGYSRQTPDAQRPWAQDQARLVQRAIREEMDAAMTRTLPAGDMTRALADRRSYHTAEAVNRIGDAAEQRRLGNRQMPLSDNIQVAAAEGILGKAQALIANRLIRGREHAFMAMLQEREANQLAREISRRLGEGGSRTQAARIIASARRGGPALGVALRELTESSPEAAQVVAESMATAAPDAIQRIADDPAGGLGGDEQTSTMPRATVREDDYDAIANDPAGGL